MMSLQIKTTGWLFPPKPKRHARAIGGGFDGGFARECLEQIDAATAGTMKIGAIRWVGNEIWREALAAVADSESDLVIVRRAFELDLARAAFLAAVANGVRHTLGKGEQD